MQLQTPLPSPANTAGLFAGRDLRDVLEQRTEAAIAAIGRLATWDDDSEMTGRVSHAYDVTVPSPRWNEGRVQFGASADQKMTAAWSWTVDGDAEILAYTPTTYLSSDLPFASLVGSEIRASVVDQTLTANQVDALSAEVNRWVNRNLANVATEVEEWRPSHRRAIRDALRKRRDLLERVLELEAAA